MTTSVFVRCETHYCNHNKDGCCTLDTIRINSFWSCACFDNTSTGGGVV